jgi:acyl carrier protein
MTDAEIYQRLKRVFLDIFDELDVELTAETSAADIPEWTSFNHVNIIVACEQAFGVKFLTPEIETLKNVGDLVALIRGKLAAKK